MKKLILAVLLMSAQFNTRAQQRIELYAASQEGITIKGFDTTVPHMDYYPSTNPSAKKTAVLICPGGGYGHLPFSFYLFAQIQSLPAFKTFWVKRPPSTSKCRKYMPLLQFFKSKIALV